MTGLFTGRERQGMNKKPVLLKLWLNRTSRINNEWRVRRESVGRMDICVCVFVGWAELDMLTCSRLEYAVLRDSELTMLACRVKLTWAKLTWHQLSTVTHPLPHSPHLCSPSPSSTSQATTWEAHGGCDPTNKKNNKESVTHFFQGGLFIHHRTSTLTMEFRGVKLTKY